MMNVTKLLCLLPYHLAYVSHYYHVLASLGGVWLSESYHFNNYLSSVKYVIPHTDRLLA
jgi:hypothetical protein